MAFFSPRFWPWLLAVISFSSMASGDLSLGPMPISLKNQPLPNVPGLLDGSDPIVVDKSKAIALGKALFWDMNLGSDLVACASCHFHAGADSRIKNQLAPGGESSILDSEQLAFFPSNYALTGADFPLHKKQDPFQESSAVLVNYDLVVGSSGTFSGVYQNIGQDNQSVDDCQRSVDDIFHVTGIGTRRVTPRNAPSIINSVFNYRNFWDGRANNIFNGSSPWGERDPNAGVWVSVDGQVSKQQLHLINSSLASLATAPPVNATEMSCQQRTLPDIAQKLLKLQPLAMQKVHWNDSVLGSLSLSSVNSLQAGLNISYEALIKQAFNSKFWQYEGENEKFGQSLAGVPYKQLEANFGLFLGLSIQLYESTLISDESPFDQSTRDANQRPIDLSASELRGLEQFRVNLCSHCHAGANFTTVAVDTNASTAETPLEVFGDTVSASRNVVKRIPGFVRNTAVTVFSDVGFASTGVAKASQDIGLAATDPFGNPLSFSEQYLQYLAGNNTAVKDEVVRDVRACDFEEPLAINFKSPYRSTSIFIPEDGILPQPQNTERCFLDAGKYAFIPTVAAAKAELDNPETTKMLTKLNASFKIPSLRNIELTGPYMHNGSMATLEQVIEFYARGGNFSNDAKETTLVFPLPKLQFSAQNRKDLIAFLKTLTDERVRYQQAPFDHPEIWVSQGHVGNYSTVLPYAAYPNFAMDEFLVLPAVGASGMQQPLQPFAYYLQ
ncbi:MAG: cytochrome-c peroxidase [Methylococcaceae bacterium]|nr:cytochrome-c peroxidase [Methylococcaceae bacterium]